MKDKSKKLPPIQTASGIPPVIVVSGTNYEMGFQYGRQTASRIYRNVIVSKYASDSEHIAQIESTMKMIYPDMPEMPPLPIPKRTAQSIKNDMKVLLYYTRKYNPGLIEWFDGIVAGCAKEGYDINHEDLMLVTILYSYLFWAPVTPYPKEAGVPGGPPATEQEQDTTPFPKPHSCNSFAATGKATKDGKPIVSLNGGGADCILERLILIAFPKEGCSFISFPHAGRLTDQMAMNRSGFSWVMTANFSITQPWGVMPEVIWHYLAQYCKSPAEAQKYLKTIPRTGATGNFVMSDTTGNICVVETNADHFAIRKPGDTSEKGEFLVNANHFAGTKTLAYNVPDWEVINRDSICRYATLWQYVSDAAASGKIDFDFIKKMYKSNDWYNPDTKQWHWSTREVHRPVRKATISQRFGCNYFPSRPDGFRFLY